MSYSDSIALNSVTKTTSTMNSEDISMAPIFNRILSASLFVMTCSCKGNGLKTLETIADTRTHKASFVNHIMTFDQPLLNKKGKQIRNNRGICTRTRVSEYFECQWTLTLDAGSIQVAGREMDNGTLPLSAARANTKALAAKWNPSITATVRLHKHCVIDWVISKLIELLNQYSNLYSNR